MLIRGMFRLVFALALITVPLARPASGSDEEVSRAVKKSIPLLQSTNKFWVEKMTCVSCHHSILPVMVLKRAREREAATVVVREPEVAGVSADRGGLRRCSGLVPAAYARDSAPRAPDTARTSTALGQLEASTSGSVIVLLHRRRGRVAGRSVRLHHEHPTNRRQGIPSTQAARSGICRLRCHDGVW